MVEPLPSSDTIFALSSGALPSGVAVIRLSGSGVEEAVRSIAGILPEPNIACLRPFRDRDGRIVDRGLVLYFRAPRSVTGEDCAEFHCHGGRAVVAAMYRILGSFNGVRLAEEGEFTRRALANGKYDLVQVEALADLIDSETEGQRKLALRGFDGEVSGLFDGWSERLTRARAFLEAELDFSDEGDVPDDISDAIWQDLCLLAEEMRSYIDDGGSAELIRDGYRVVIMGPPNAGKSSLLNALARRDVAIVSDEAGTTRDLVEVALDIGGNKIIVIDTAGIRETDGRVEAIGIERAQAAGRAADLVLWLEAPEDLALQEGIAAPPGAVVLCSKTDLSPARPGCMGFSARTGAGLNDVIALLGAKVQEAIGKSGSAMPLRLRHAALVKECHEHLKRALEPDSAPLEVRAESLRLASYALGRITGSVDVEDLLDRIFSSFCIGK